jgi:hypothetical protein
MDILALKLVMTEADVNGLVAAHLPANQPVRDLRVSLTPEGIRLSGSYPVTFFNIAFHTLWAIALSEGRVIARLAGLQVAGAPAGMVRGMLMEAVADNLRGEDGFRVEGDSIFVDLDRALGRFGLSARTNLTAVHCENGRLVLEGGRN